MVDDGSEDGTSEIVRDLFPEVHVISGDGNLFWNRGMRLAWENAAVSRPDYYLWINDDTFLNENAVKVLVDGCRCRERESVIVGAIGSERHPGPTYGGRNAQAVLLAPNGTWQKCQLFNGNCVLIPATVFDRLGNLDEHFHHALGDFEYGLRAIAAGIDSYLTPCYVGTCEKHTSLPDWCNPEVSFRKRWQLFFSPLGCSPKDLFYFNRKYRNLFWAVGVLASNFLRVCFPQYWCQSKEKK